MNGSCSVPLRPSPPSTPAPRVDMAARRANGVSLSGWTVTRPRPSTTSPRRAAPASPSRISVPWPKVHPRPVQAPSCQPPRSRVTGTSAAIPPFSAISAGSTPPKWGLPCHRKTSSSLPERSRPTSSSSMLYWDPEIMWCAIIRLTSSSTRCRKAWERRSAYGGPGRRGSGCRTSTNSKLCAEKVPR